MKWFFFLHLMKLAIFSFMYRLFACIHAYEWNDGFQCWYFCSYLDGLPLLFMDCWFCLWHVMMTKFMDLSAWFGCAVIGEQFCLYPVIDIFLLAIGDIIGKAYFSSSVHDTVFIYQHFTFFLNTFCNKILLINNLNDFDKYCPAQWYSIYTDGPFVFVDFNHSVFDAAFPLLTVELYKIKIEL